MAGKNSEAVAQRLTSAIRPDEFPSSAAWDSAAPIRFCADWQGKNADAKRATEVRLLWTPETLYLQFRARYRTVTVFSDAASNGRRDHLWDRDVCETFLQPDPRDRFTYSEFEVSPNGFWIDLRISAGRGHDLRSGLRRRASIDKWTHAWRAELAIPMKSLAAKFDPATPWRVNFFRIEGSAEPRFYSAWRPTCTSKPNFHVPQAFGELRFAE